MWWWKKKARVSWLENIMQGSNELKREKIVTDRKEEEEEEDCGMSVLRIGGKLYIYFEIEDFVA